MHEERDLDELLTELRGAAPADRITLRDPIIAHGGAAVRPLESLVADVPDLGPSVAAWLEVLAKRDPGTRQIVVAALRGLALSGDATTARHAAAALDRLGASAAASRPAGEGTRSIPAAAGTGWPGFQAHEFGRNEGTRWRSAEGRESLAPLLAGTLRELDPDFISFGVERSPEVHFAVARRYRGSPVAGWTASKLVVYAHGPTDEAPDMPRQVAAGWYIERGDGSERYGRPDNPTDWDWPLVMAALRRPAFRARLVETMERHGLAFGDYPGHRFAKALGWSAVIEEGEIVARDAGGSQVASGWEEVLGRIAGVAPDEWIDLHLVRTWSAEVAIGAGQPFALRELAPVLRDLGALYLAALRGP
jgi:hypothetical protein